MRNLLIGLVTTILALSWTTMASARQIPCPAGEVKTNVTTRIPSPWWHTPQAGPLDSTRISEIGGETTLVCVYDVNGTMVSVMRKPPNRMPHCVTRDNGFTCRARAFGGGGGGGAPVTHKTGPLSIPQTYRADLDNGTVSSGGADIWFEADTATRRYITPVNGAKLAIHSGGATSKQVCADTPKTSNRIPIASVPVGTYVCVLTNEGRDAIFRVNAAVGASPGTLEIGFTTWE